MYRNRIPHTFPWDMDERKASFSPYIRFTNFLDPETWVRICWHYPGGQNSSFSNSEWSLADGPAVAVEHACEWLRAYLDWKVTGAWSYGGIDHIPSQQDLKRRRYDCATFKRDQMASCSAPALAFR